MKLTAVTGPKGELVALVRAHLSEHDSNKSYAAGPHATLRPGPGQTFSELLAPDGHRELSHEALTEWVMGQLHSRRQDELK